MSRLHSAACERNRGPILEVLREVFPEEGLALEIASGTGVHAVTLAAAFPRPAWHPPDGADAALARAAAWRARGGAAGHGTGPGCASTAGGAGGAGARRRADSAARGGVARRRRGPRRGPDGASCLLLRRDTSR